MAEGLQPTLSDFRCRKCRAGLLDKSNIIDIHGDPYFDPGKTESDKTADDVSVWYISMATTPDWISDQINKANWMKAKLTCTKCEGRVGSFDFTRVTKCSCCSLTCPQVHLLRSRVDRKFKVISSAVQINSNLKVVSSDMLRNSATSSQINIGDEQIYNKQNEDINEVILPHTPNQHLTNTVEKDMENSFIKIDKDCETEKVGCLCVFSSNYSHENVKNSLQSMPMNENAQQSVPTNENTQHFISKKENTQYLLSNNGSSQNFMSTNGNTENLMSTNGSTENLLSINGNTENFMSTNENTENLMSTNGNTENLMSTNGNTENLMSTNGNTENVLSINGNTENLLSINGNLILTEEKPLPQINHSCKKDSKMILKLHLSNICDSKQDSCRNKTCIDPLIEAEFAGAIRENCTMKEDHIETERLTDLTINGNTENLMSTNGNTDNLMSTNGNTENLMSTHGLRGTKQFPQGLNLSRSSSVESLNQDDLLEGVQENVDIFTFQNENATNYDFDVDNPFILLEERSTEHDVQEEFLEEGREEHVKGKILKEGTKVQKELIKGGKRQRKRNNRQQGPKKMDTNDFHSMFEAAYRWQKPTEELVFPHEHVCAICLELFCLPMQVLPCQHIYCEPCLRQMAKSTVAVTTLCPLCRKPIIKCEEDVELRSLIADLYPVEDQQRHRRQQSFLDKKKYPLPQCDPNRGRRQRTFMNHIEQQANNAMNTRVRGFVAIVVFFGCLFFSLFATLLWLVFVYIPSFLYSALSDPTLCINLLAGVTILLVVIALSNGWCRRNNRDVQHRRRNRNVARRRN